MYLLWKFFFFFSCSFNMIYLGMAYLLCILVFSGLPESVAWLSYLILKSSLPLFLHIILLLYFLFFAFHLHIMFFFYIVPSSLEVLGFHSFFLFEFQTRYSLLPYLQDHGSFLILFESIDEPVEGILHFCYSSFLFLAFHFTAFWDSLHTLVICLTCCVLFPLETLTYWSYHGHYIFPAWSF